MSLLSPEVESTYEILELMGEGGMGAVYKVRHRVFGDLSVIKVMKANLQGNAKLRERFENEARKGKQLDHPNIAKVVNFFVGSNGNAHLVMEYIDGVNLKDLQFRRRVPFDAATVVAIGTQALAALQCMHERKLIHRDISPDNLMLVTHPDGSQTVKLIDLGISKSLDETFTGLTEYGSFIGKVAYASPEQFGDPIDARSDLYSFGVVLYELVTGAKPITGTSFGSYAIAHQSTPPRSFADTDPQGLVPENLRRVILKALEKARERRHQNATEFAAALRACVADTPTIDLQELMPTAPVSVIAGEPTVPSGSGYWRIAAVAAVLFVIAGAAMGLRMIGRRTSSEGQIEVVERKLPSADKEIDRGKVLIAQGKNREAYDAFASATRIDPENAFAWTNYGAAAMLLKNPDEAMLAYQRALKLKPNEWLTHYNLGCLYARTGRKDEALNELAAAVKQMREEKKSSPQEARSILKSIRADEALKELRNDPRYRKIVAQ